ncbi:cellulase family glycosylhydrolase [Paraglaciecola sp.]|uniref:cellulase family glycosylhydrolase n=2 Tax=Paraglaciecola sp. TaxID=1920173 RepID=UPI0032988404
MKKIAAAISIIAMSSSLSASAQEALSGDDWLHTQGNQVVDKDGNPVWLTGANWFGFNATERTFHGLWSVNLETTLQSIADRGINILRVPISTELLWEWSNGQFSTPNVNTSTNPNLIGLNNLEVFDRFIEVSKSIGLKVMLDVHSAEADNSGHVYPLWYKDTITTEIFYESWEWVTQRYVNDDTIIAMDIQNEPHGQPWSGQDFAKWDDSTDINNFKYACETASNRILAINPNLLVLCEGIESFPIDNITWTSTDSDDYYSNWWGGNLRGVIDYPIDLGANQDQLMYSPHDYGPLVFAQDWFYAGFDKDSLYNDVWKDNWMFIHEQGISPLLIGEWGGFMDGADNEKWMFALRDLIVEHQLHHTFWVVNPNSGDTGGLLNNDWTTWDEDKYALLKPALWQDSDNKFVGLDHQIPLGSSATGITVSEYYSDITITPSTAITSPSANSEVIQGDDFTIAYNLSNLSGVNIYLNETLVEADQSSGSLALTAPVELGEFTVSIIGLDATGAETDIQDQVTLLSVEENMVPPATISITSPANASSFAPSEDFTVTVDYDNAGGFAWQFDDQSGVVLDAALVQLSAPSIEGTYPLEVTALDEAQNPLDASESINIVVTPITASDELTCDIGSANTWSTGYVLGEITLTNNGSETVSSWSATLTLGGDALLSNGWNANFTTQDDSIVASNMPYNNTIGPGQSVTFGMQATYSGTFVQPSCTAN